MIAGQHYLQCDTLVMLHNHITQCATKSHEQVLTNSFSQAMHILVNQDHDHLNPQTASVNDISSESVSVSEISTYSTSRIHD